MVKRFIPRDKTPAFKLEMEATRTGFAPLKRLRETSGFSPRSFIVVVFLSIFLSTVLSCARKSEDKGQEEPSKSYEEFAASQRQVQDSTSQSPAPDEIAGELFGVAVPLGNYYFARLAVTAFSATWRSSPKTEEELEDLVWQELVLSFEAFRRGIEVTDEEKDREIAKIMQVEEVEFDYKTDAQAYNDWAKNKLGSSTMLFENMIDHLIKLRKLRDQVFDSLDPEVTEEEAYQKFLDEHNTLSVELRRFDEFRDAEKLYKEAIVPPSNKDWDNLIWQDLVLSYETFKRGFEVEDKEVDDSIKVLLQDLNADFNVYLWEKEEKEKYALWVKENTGFSPQEFKDYIRHFVKINKLIADIFQGQESGINLDIYQDFLKRSRSVSLAYDTFPLTFKFDEGQVIRFDDLAKAKEFYKQIKRDPRAWETQRRKEPREFKRPGFVSLDFLINLWGFERDAAYAMLEKSRGDFYPPAPIYKGYAVFKVLKIRKALDKEYEKSKDHYLQRVRTLKKYKGFKEWKENLIRAANIKVYVGNKEKGE